MFECQQIHSEHKDIIHDVAYDFYGLRMATCSSDHTIKVWDKGDSEWNVTASWKAHSGSVWRLSWAHPEFGQVLASCSFDRTVSVWEETLEKPSPTMAPARKWVRRTNLVDSRTNVTDCKFAPKHLGLMLATSSADGVLRIYEAPEIMNLSQWTLQHEITAKLPLSCLSWNPSIYRLHAPMIAAGSDETSAAGSGGKVFIFEYGENSRRWAKTETIGSLTEAVTDLAFAPSLGRSYHVLAVASKDLHIFNLRPVLEPSASARLDVQQVGQFSDHGSVDRGAENRVWRVTWNVTGTLLASTGDDGCVRFWKMNYLRNWRCVCVITSDGGSAGIGAMNLEGLNTLNTDRTLGSSTTKYYKKGPITHPNQVPWH